MPGRRLPLLGVAVLLGVLSACQVRAGVDVVVDPDGSGTVTVVVELDPAAAQRLGDPSTALATGDLAEAGWDVEDPSVADDGTVGVRAVRSFGSPEQLATVLDEVGGVDGVFGDVELTVTDGFSSTDYDLTLTVELTGNPEQFGDEELTAALGGQPLARSLEQLALEGAADPDAMRLALSVHLPGGPPETDGEVVDGAAVWSFPVTGGEPTSASLSTASTDRSPRTWWMLAGAAAAIVAAAAVAATAWRLARR